MRYEKNRKIFGLDEYKVLKYGRLLLIPAGILLLILGVLFLDMRRDKQAKSVAENRNQVTEETVFVPENTLRRNEILEITDLINTYQAAKLTADADKLYALFGKDPATIDDALRKKLKDEAKMYEYFSADTAVYIADGASAEEFVVYAKMYLKFKKAETPAPMLFSMYVTSQDGVYKIVDSDSLSSEQQSRILAMNETPEVQRMYMELKNELSIAVVEDVNLADKYKDFVEGELRFLSPEKTKESLAAKQESIDASIAESAAAESAAAESTAPAAESVSEESSGEEVQSETAAP